QQTPESQPAEPQQPVEPQQPAEQQPAEPQAPAPAAEETPAPPAPRPAPPVPRPGPRPTPTPPAAPPAPPAAPVPDATAPVETTRSPSADWGRVGDDGTVFVRTSEGERPVGQMPDATPDEALAFFTKRYDDLAFEVELLEQRVQAGTVGPDEAAAAVKQVRATLAEAQAVGDLEGLAARLETLTGLISAQREKRKAERAVKLAAARTAKERIADEAESLAHSQDWRNGANRLRDLLDEWKSLPRLEKAVDDALWRRFSTARTTYTRRRKAHFGELNEKREGARVVKERLVKEAEDLAGSTEWGPTAGRYRDLMRQWKAAGPAPRGVDDQLWKRFRAAQDQFFGARDAANAELDQEYAANAEKKEALLAEAEKLVPVTDLAAAKQAFRDLAERWDAAGKVPRDRMKELEGRIRKVEQAIRSVEDDQWRRSNPEARARAADTVAQLEASIADLQAKHDKAVAAGNDKKAAEHAAALEARRSWLAEAQKALDEFS
ncbi:MAG TPA: DUF349 domain-containing protein, partial [Nocardioides sp.]|nr:DUF349 domain-containing protein [Nocardioides sp.]